MLNKKYFKSIYFFINGFAKAIFEILKNYKKKFLCFFFDSSHVCVRACFLSLFLCVLNSSLFYIFSRLKKKRRLNLTGTPLSSRIAREISREGLVARLTNKKDLTVTRSYASRILR